MKKTLGLAGIVLSSLLSLSNMGCEKRDKPCLPRDKIPIARKIEQIKTPDNIASGKKEIPSSDTRTYALKDFLTPGNYEVKLNKGYVSFRTYPYDYLVSYEQPYLEFVDLNNPNNKKRIYLENLDLNNGYNVSTEDSNLCNILGQINFKEKLEPEGKVLGTIKSSDIKLHISKKSSEEEYPILKPEPAPKYPKLVPKK